MGDDWSDNEFYFRRVVRWMGKMGHDVTQLVAWAVEEIGEGVTPTTPDTGTTSLAPSSPG